jgi:hypothetical protein
MLSFKEHSALKLDESFTKAAKDMENLLVDTANGVSKRYSAIQPFLKKGGFKTSKDLGKKIFRNAGIRGTSGSMVGSQSVNKPKWRGDNKTPKTDIIVDRMKISLKTGDSQLMSGGSAEALSTYEAALDNTKFIKKQIKKLANECEKGIKDLLPNYLGKQKGGIGTQKRSGVFKKDRILKAADDFNHILKKKFIDLFQLKDDFKKEFVFEAMTGNVKFNGNNGTATHFLVCDFDGNAKFHKVTSSKSSYVKKILPQVNPNIRFKSVSQKSKGEKTGHYSFRGVVSLLYKAALKEQQDLEYLVSNGELEYLSEGFFDKIKSMINKVTNYITSIFNKVESFITQSAEYFADFLGLAVDNITFKNSVKW